MTMRLTLFVTAFSILLFGTGFALNPAHETGGLSVHPKGAQLPAMDAIPDPDTPGGFLPRGGVKSFAPVVSTRTSDRLPMRQQ